MKLTQITQNKKQFLDLLLLADEQESMIDLYLERGEMFVLEDGGVKAVCVVTDEGNGVCELKNIAVKPDAQRQGYGKKLINSLMTHYSGRYHQIIVGTGDVPSAIGFYESGGFVYSHRIENFFTDNYDHTIIENGIVLKDMVYLKQEISSNIILKPYSARVPACGVFCGGCPAYVREKKPCPGAGQNKVRCEKCKTFHLCCKERGITYCFQCNGFPCAKFKSFAKRWLKHGQDFIKNQQSLSQLGEMEFIRVYNERIRADEKVPANMNIISVRERPLYAERIISYLQKCWSEVPSVVYSDCVNHCIDAVNPLPQWYVLEKEGEFVGCAGLVTNDFISRMDLYPWLCALFIDENHRGNGYGQVLVEKAKADAKKFGFANLYLCTDHVGYYERYGFQYIGEGYHPWEGQSRIYEITL